MFLHRPVVFLLLLSPWAARAAEPEPTGDPVAGALVADTCRACHALEPGGEKKWGPPLVGVVDGPMGAEEGYRYGAYLRAQNEAGAVWSDAALRAWLVDSKAVAKAADGRTKMRPQRLPDDQIDDLLAYLRTLQ